MDSTIAYAAVEEIEYRLLRPRNHAKRPHLSKYTHEKLYKNLSFQDADNETTIQIQPDTGKIVAKELEVSGSLKTAQGGSFVLGDSTTTTPGAIRYNKTDADFQGYDGTAWRSLTVGSGNGSVFSGAIVRGAGNTASASYSSAWGEATSARGSNATAWGNDSAATGNNSTAWGEITSATGFNATAWGVDTNATSPNSTSWGEQTRASGNNSTAWGETSTATAKAATAWGKGDATDEFSTAWGSGNAEGAYSTAWGRGTTKGDNSTAWGITGTGEDAVFATSWGVFNSANSVLSTVWGIGNNVEGHAGTAWGIQNKAVSYASTAFGKYNIGGYTFLDDNNDSNDGDNKWFDVDPLLEIGVGTNKYNRANALTLLKDGRIALGKHTALEDLQSREETVQVEGALLLGNYANAPDDPTPGAIRYNNTDGDFQGYKGEDAGWVSLTTSDAETVQSASSLVVPGSTTAKLSVDANGRVLLAEAQGDIPMFGQ